MSYQKAFSTLGCPEFDLDEVCALAEHHGVGAIEIRALQNSVDLPARLADECGTPSALVRRLRGRPIKIISLDTPFKLVGSSDAERDALLDHVPWAEALGTRLRVFDGGKPDDLAAFEEMSATLDWWRDLRARNRWQTDLIVETHDNLLTGQAIRRLVARDPDIGVLWDAHHTWRKGGESPLTTWRLIRDSVVQIHVKDSISTNHPTDTYHYCLPGEGGFPMQSLREMLALEYSGPVSLEWERMWHPELPSLDSALHAAAKANWWGLPSSK